MNVQATGMVFVSECSVKSDVCTARTAAPITAVWELESRKQINVCRACFKKLVADGDWNTSYTFEPDAHKAPR